jgi:hypothetical protein
MRSVRTSFAYRTARLRSQSRSFPSRVVPYARFLLNRRAYAFLSEDELRRTRRSDTAFIFGSGASLNELTSDEWEDFERHDTIGFNWFVRQEFVRCDYQLIRGIPDTDLSRQVWEPQVREYFQLACDNPRFARTIYLVQTGFRATNGNRAIGYRLLPASNPVFLWRTRTDRDAAGASFTEGLTHGVSTLQETVNFAYVLGWRRIVLVGVDLYDRRYFWLPGDRARPVDEQRGAEAGDTHSASGVIDRLGVWRERFAEDGVELLVYRSESLLSRVLPVYADARV